MYLKEMKEQILKFIEEINPESELLTDDPDISAKINDTINQVMFELARIKKIAAYETLEVKADEEIELEKEIKNFYQLEVIKGIEYENFNNFVIPKEDGTAKIFYYKYPKRISSNTSDTEYKFELSDDVLEIMPYGVAGDLLLGDVSNRYGQIYLNRYNELKQGLDPRYNKGSIVIGEGINI